MYFKQFLQKADGKDIVHGVNTGYGYGAVLSHVDSDTVPMAKGSCEGAALLSFAIN